MNAARLPTLTDAPAFQLERLYLAHPTGLRLSPQTNIRIIEIS
jgi:hypothetical protein